MHDVARTRSERDVLLTDESVRFGIRALLHLAEAPFIGRGEELKTHTEARALSLRQARLSGTVFKFNSYNLCHHLNYFVLVPLRLL